MTNFKVVTIFIALMSLMNCIRSDDATDINAMILKQYNNFIGSYDVSTVQRNITGYKFTGGEYNYRVCNCKVNLSLSRFGIQIHFDAYWPKVSMSMTGLNDLIGNYTMTGNSTIEVTVTDLWARNTYLLFNPVLFKFTAATILPSIKTATFRVLSSDLDLSSSIKNLNENFATWLNTNNVALGKEIGYYIVNNFYGSGVSMETIPDFLHKCSVNKKCDANSYPTKMN